MKVLMDEAALAWLRRNTNLDLDAAPLPPSVELFVEKYGQIMSLRPGVTSESISGLSQSFDGDVSALLWSYARELFGEESLVGGAGAAVAVPAVRPWI